MGSFPPVNSVVRALSLLRELNKSAVSTVDQLYIQTRIPKSTIVRLLQTLEAQGLVRHAPQHGAYCLTSEVSKLSSGYHGVPRLIEASAAQLDEMTRQVKWPLAIAIPETDAVSIRYSTVPLSPLSLHHSSLGMRLSLVSRALGRAYLAFCDDGERDALISIVKKSDDREDLRARDDAAMKSLIDNVRQRGLATRDPHVRTVSNTLAVPIFEGSRVVASVGLTFIASAMTQDEAIRRHHQDLVELSSGISRRLESLAGKDLPAPSVIDLASPAPKAPEDRRQIN
jgi:IclR family transcriptional regulator, mhp operon transcriptional activator